MAVTERHISLAKKIDQHVNSVVTQGGDDETLLVSMADFMGYFKKVMDTTTAGEMTELSERFNGFYRFGKLLESLAQGIQDGDIQVPSEQGSDAVDKTDHDSSGMKLEKPCSPGHCLGMLNANMRTDMLRSVHQGIEERKEETGHASPLVMLIESIEQTLVSFTSRNRLVTIGPNPFNNDPHYHGFDADADYLHDLKLLQSQLGSLHEILDSLTE